MIPALAVSLEAKSCDTCKWSKKPTMGATDTPTTCSALGNRPVDLTIMTAAQAQAQRQMIGSGCGWYNSDAPNPKFSDTVPVAFPLRDVDPDKISSYQKAPVQTCLDCENFVPPSEMEKLGFGPQRGLCAAKGALLQGSRLRAIASNCDVRRKGRNIDQAELTMLKLFPEYTIKKIDEFIEENNKKREQKCLPTGYDPATYVHPKLAGIPAEGVRTWVDITDPTGTGNSVAIPVFDPNFFDPIERAKIPTALDEARPDLYVDHEGILYRVVVALMRLDETPALWGIPGVGKTELGRYLAWVMSIPFERITITDSVELDDIQGSMRFENNETVFHEGRVTRGWGKPNVLLIDEPNVGPRAVWQFLRPLTDNSKQLVLDADRGQVIRRNDNCFLMFAMNPAWDVRNDGTNTLADADIRRLFHIEMHLPTEEVEREIIKSHCRLDGFDIPDKLLDLVMNVSTGIRALVDDSLPITWGIAPAIKVARYMNWFDPVTAYRMAVADSLEPDIRDLILDEVRTKFGLLS